MLLVLSFRTILILFVSEMYHGVMCALKRPGSHILKGKRVGCGDILLESQNSEAGGGPQVSDQQVRGIRDGSAVKNDFATTLVYKR